MLLSIKKGYYLRMEEERREYMISIKDYLGLISGSLSIIIALILMMLSFKLKYKSRIYPLRVTAVILVLLGILSIISIFFN